MRTANSFRFIAITDSHIVKKARAGYCEDVFVRTRALKPSFFVNTGDICHKSTKSAYDFYKAAKAKAGSPVFDVQGNHDGNFREHLGPVRYCFEYGKVHFISMGNGYTNDKRPKGKWLQAIVAAVPKDRKIVFFNHVGPGHGKLGFLSPRKKDLLAIIHGHGHAGKSYEIDGVKCFMTGYMAYYVGFSIFDVKDGKLTGSYVKLGWQLTKDKAAKDARWDGIAKEYTPPPKHKATD